MSNLQNKLLHIFGNVALTLRSQASKEPRDKKMWEAVACFSAGSAFQASLPSSPPRRAKVANDDLLKVRKI